MSTRTYMVWSEDQGGTEDDARPFVAYSESDAAEEWAQWDDSHSADYLIVRGNDATVKVRGEYGIHTFVVSGESVARYRARTA